MHDLCQRCCWQTNGSTTPWLDGPVVAARVTWCNVGSRALKPGPLWSRPITMRSLPSSATS